MCIRDSDILMLDYIKRSKREFAVVATKSDKVKRSEHKKNIDNIRRKLNLDDGSKVIPFSSPVSYTHLDVYKRQAIDRTFSRFYANC